MAGISGDANVKKSACKATEAPPTSHEVTASVQHMLPPYFLLLFKFTYRDDLRITGTLNRWASEGLDMDVLAEMDKMMMELSNNYAILREQTKQAFFDCRKIFDMKEKEVMSTYQATFEHKLNILTKHREKMAATLASQTSFANPPPLPSQPAITGAMYCGFVPEMINLVQSTACLVLEHREEVGVGTETKASIVGSINAQGLFWVRVLPDEGGVQDHMLQNLSNTMGVELSLSSPSPLKCANPGDICCALYVEDQRWYRARVIEVLNNQNAKVYFVDYGNMETIAFSNLCALHPKFLVYPFQMIQCCFSEDQQLSYERELRWKFTDLTHGSNLSIKILELLPSNVHGVLHRVQLTNRSSGGGEPFEVGAIITLMAQPSEAKLQSSSTMKSRDIRYAGKLPNQQTLPIEDAPEASLPKPTPGGGGEQEVVKGSGLSPTPKTTNGGGEVKENDLPTEKETTTSSEGYCMTSSEDGRSISTISCETQMTTPKTPGRTTPTNGSSVDALTSDHSYPTSDPVESVRQDVEVRVQIPCSTLDASTPIDARSKACSPVPHVEVLKPSPSVIGLESEQRLNGHIGEASPVTVAGACVDQCRLKKGDNCSMLVTTPLSEDGTFYAQLTSAGEPTFTEMMQRLQKYCTEQPPAPGFFSPGDLCAAQFSEDGGWYRARVETIIKNQLMVRYLDFGNQELRGRDSMMSLGSEFREVPFQAVWCSIATVEHSSFTEKQMECFVAITSSQKLMATVLATEEGKAMEVQLHLMLSDMDATSVNEEVYVADFKMTESMNFSQKEQAQDKAESNVKVIESKNFSRKELALEKAESPNAAALIVPSLTLSDSSEITFATDWADFMDEIQSPKNDGVYTLPGQESGSSRYTPTPSPPVRNTPSPQLPIPSPPDRVPSPSSSIPTYSSRLKSGPCPGHKSGAAWSSSAQKDVKASSSGHGGCTPRILSSALSMVRKNLISEREKGKRTRLDQVPRDTPTSGSAGMDTLTTNSLSYHASPTPSSSSSVPPIIPPGLAEPKGMRSLNQIVRNGTSFPPSGRRRKSPDPDSTQVKLFVRYMPHNKSMEEVYHLFSLYGHIHTLEYHSEHKDKLYLIMDKVGGMKAVKGLDGNHMVGSPKPLSVQQYKGSSVQSLEQTELDNLPSHICSKLFVKNIPLDKTVEEIRTIFSQYGKVLGIVPIPSRKNVVFVYMDPKAATIAIDCLHGRAISKNSRPMIVEISNFSRSGRSTPNN